MYDLSWLNPTPHAIAVLINVSSIDIVVPRECAAQSNREYIPTKKEALASPSKASSVVCVWGNNSYCARLLGVTDYCANDLSYGC